MQLQKWEHKWWDDLFLQKKCREQRKKGQDFHKQNPNDPTNYFALMDRYCQKCQLHKDCVACSKGCGKNPNKL